MACLLVIVLQLAVVQVPSMRSSNRSGDVRGYAFEDYKRDYGRDYSAESAEHDMRQRIFSARLGEVQAHNSKGHLWRKGINHLSDRTGDELRSMHGYKPRPKNRNPDVAEEGGTSMLEVCAGNEASCENSDCCSDLVCGAAGKCIDKKSAPDEHDWSSLLDTAIHPLDQGQCGSCWAVAAAATIQFAAEISAHSKGNHFRKTVSPQSILSCTPNEHECGGTGGCKGATAELAFEYASSLGPGGGVRTIDMEPYTATSGSCQRQSTPSFLQTQASVAISVNGFKKLRENDAQQLADTLVNVGPVAVSIAANGFHHYQSGIFDNSNGDLIVNHAVVMMGYGKDPELDKSYWKVRNSWGASWGEKGHIRVLRYWPNAPEPKGVDTDPSKGVACKGPNGYPDEQKVQGTAGILMDSAYPLRVVAHDALLEDASTEIAAGGVTAIDGEVSAAEGSQAWCEAGCQHFDFSGLKDYYKGKDFGTDVDACVRACESNVAP